MIGLWFVKPCRFWVDCDAYMSKDGNSEKTGFEKGFIGRVFPGGGYGVQIGRAQFEI